MPTHAEKRLLPYTPEQLFDLVADVERYPEFLPWCVGARIRERRDNVIFADLLIGWRMVRERFTSRVTLDRPDRIDVELHRRPVPLSQESLGVRAPADGGCLLDFYVDFEFRSRMLQGVIAAAVQRGGEAHGLGLREARPRTLRIALRLGQDGEALFLEQGLGLGGFDISQKRRRVMAGRRRDQRRGIDHRRMAVLGKDRR